LSNNKVKSCKNLILVVSNKFIYYIDNTSSAMPQMPEKVGKNYKIIRKIDEGAFG